MSRKFIAVQFIAGHLAVSADHARTLLGYAQASDCAWRKAWCRFRAVNGIRPVPGTSVFPLRKIERAVES